MDPDRHTTALTWLVAISTGITIGTVAPLWCRRDLIAGAGVGVGWWLRAFAPALATWFAIGTWAGWQWWRRTRANRVRNRHPDARGYRTADGRIYHPDDVGLDHGAIHNPAHQHPRASDHRHTARDHQPNTIDRWYGDGTHDHRPSGL